MNYLLINFLSILLCNFKNMGLTVKEEKNMNSRWNLKCGVVMWVQFLCSEQKQNKKAMSFFIHYAFLFQIFILFLESKLMRHVLYLIEKPST